MSETCVELIEKLKAENERIGNIAVQYEHDIDSLRVENARLLSLNSHVAAENMRMREALEAITLMVNAQSRDEGLWSIPWEGLQPISEVHLQQELRRLHECVEHRNRFR